MSRLVVFGCSHTYGHGLRDCYDPLTGHPGPQPSLQAWPARLVELLRQTHDPNISLVKKIRFLFKESYTFIDSCLCFM